MFAAIGSFGDDDGAVAHAGHADQGVLDFADLDAESGDLDLAVAAAEEFQFAVGTPAAEVAGQVEALAGAVGIGTVGLARCVRDR